MSSPIPEPSATAGETATTETRQPSTASLIVERAAELFANKGFSGTSIREIAEAAGVTKPTLYYYFGSKEGLIRHIIGGVMAGLAESMASHIDGARSLRESLVDIARGQLEYADSHPASVALVCRLSHEPPGEPWACDLRRMQQQGMCVLRECFVTAEARGEVLPGRDPMLLAFSFLGSLLMHTVARMNRPDLWDGKSAAGIAVDITELFLGGARPPATGDGEVP